MPIWSPGFDMAAFPAEPGLLAGQSRREPIAVDVDAIWRAHGGFVWRVLHHLGLKPADIEDATQEVFVVVHRRIGDYQEQDKLRAWLYAICVRVARDHRRKLFRRRERVTDTPPERVFDATQVHSVENQQALQLAEKLLAALPEKQRVVFLLYEVEQMSMPEVALAIDCPVPTAYARLRKARERVLELVARAQLRGEAP
jgi:RNA polymerase sigma-70 factor (ECF subfamily)